MSIAVPHPLSALAPPAVGELPSSPAMPSWRGDALIFVSLENWDDIWRRNQFLCAKLSQRHPTSRILFVGLSRNLLRFWRRAAKEAANTAVPGYPNITLLHPWQVFPNRFRLGRLLNEGLERWQIRGAAKRLGLHRPLLWLNPHDAVHMAGRMDESAVVYDVTDDWSKVTQSPARARRTQRADARLCQRADAVIVCSEALAQSKLPLNAHVHLVPNGVDARHYAPSSPSYRHLTQPLETALWRGRVFGYTGTLHGDRIDIGLVRRVAGLIGNAGSVVLIGPDHLSRTEKHQLQLPNIFLVGPVPYASLPEYMRLFDVCIVPHVVSPFTESLNPIKLWEYLALGKPIVATPVAGFRDYPHFVHLAEGAQAFASWALRALEEPTEIAAARRAEAARHSWDVRCDAVERVLVECVRRRAAQLSALVAPDLSSNPVPGGPPVMTDNPPVAPLDAASQKALDVAYHREAAASYDAVVTRNFHFFHVYSLHPWIRRLRARVPSPEVLDMGTGTGVVAVILAEFGCRVTAIDHSPEMLDLARVRAKTAGVEDRLTLTLGDGETLPYADGSFDAVTIQGVLHHLPDCGPMLRESYRVLRPGGELYVSEPCDESTLVSKALRFALAPVRFFKRRLLGDRLVEPAISEHEAPVSGPGLVAQTRAAGFDVQVEYLVRTGVVQAIPERLKIWVTLLLSWPTRRTRGDILFLVGTKR